MNSSIIICSDFFDSFCKLPSKVQNKVRCFFESLLKNNFSNGLNYEKLNLKAYDKQLYSARIDEDYRAIIHEDKLEKKLYILWVDHHDEAYQWASSKRKINLSSSDIQVLNTDDYLKKGLHTQKNSNLFSRISNKQLQQLGVKQSEIELIRSIPDMKVLESYKNVLEPDVYSNLEWIANDFHVHDIVTFNNYKRDELFDLINEKVLTPAINCDSLNGDIKESVKNTFERLKKKGTVKEIFDFFEDALTARRGKQVYEELKKHKLTAFEDILSDVRKLYHDGVSS